METAPYPKIVIAKVPEAMIMMAAQPGTLLLTAWTNCAPRMAPMADHPRHASELKIATNPLLAVKYAEMTSEMLN
jgi:hypothetical protein